MSGTPLPTTPTAAMTASTNKKQESIFLLALLDSPRQLQWYSLAQLVGALDLVLHVGQCDSGSDIVSLTLLNYRECVATSKRMFGHLYG